jgi:hypothetical protein
MDFLANFPYDIRKVSIGEFVVVIRQEDTLCINGYGNLVAPFRSWAGWAATAISIYAMNNACDYLSNNVTRCAEIAQESLDGMPNLGHKFMLTYREDEMLFDNCFLVTTEHSDWWKKYHLIHNASDAGQSSQ